MAQNGFGAFRGIPGVQAKCRFVGSKKRFQLCFVRNFTGEPRGIRGTRTPPARQVDAAPTLNLMRSIDDQGGEGRL